MRTTPIADIKNSGRHKRVYITTLISGLLLVYLTVVHATTIRLNVQTLYDVVFNKNTPEKSADKRELAAVQRDIDRLKDRFDRLTPRIPYLLINTSNNQIYLKKKDQLLYKGPCSSGSDVILKATDGEEWVFKTPRGIFKIEMKLKRPVWYMPDWAFIEAGREVPPSNSRKRYNAKALGEYALSIGGGYLIHGTAYTRLIGQPVTHGCIRLDNDALDAVYKKLRYGAKVYIY